MAHMEQLIPYLELGLSLQSHLITFSPDMVSGTMQITREEYLMESEWAKPKTFSIQEIVEHIQWSKQEAIRRQKQDAEWKQKYPDDDFYDYGEASDWEEDWGVTFSSSGSEWVEYDLDEVNRLLYAGQATWIFGQFVEKPLNEEQQARLPHFLESLTKPKKTYSFFQGSIDTFPEKATQLSQPRQTKTQIDKKNALLKAYGFNWRPVERTGTAKKGWVLHSPNQEIVSEEVAMQEIARIQEPVYGHPSALWAAQMLARPGAVLLDTETTGRRKEDEIIELAIINLKGKKLVNSLFQAQQPIPSDATKVHHITDAMIQTARTFPKIWEELMAFLQKREIIIFNADFDLGMLTQTAQRYNLPMPGLHVHCLMKHVSSYIGGRKARYSLKAACYHFGIEQKEAHRALPDTQMSLAVLQALASRVSK